MSQVHAVSKEYSTCTGLCSVIVSPSFDGTVRIAALTFPSRPVISSFTLPIVSTVHGVCPLVE